MKSPLLLEIENFDKKTLHDSHHINIKFLKSIKHLNPVREKKGLVRIDKCYRFDLDDGTCLVGSIGYFPKNKRRDFKIKELAVNPNYDHLTYYSNFLCVNNNGDLQIVHLYDEESKYGFARYYSVSRADYRRYLENPDIRSSTN